MTKLLLYSLDCLDSHWGEDSVEDLQLRGLVQEPKLSSRSGDHALLQPPMSNLSFGHGLSSESRSFFLANEPPVGQVSPHIPAHP